MIDFFPTRTLHIRYKRAVVWACFPGEFLCVFVSQLLVVLPCFLRCFWALNAHLLVSPAVFFCFKYQSYRLGNPKQWLGWQCVYDGKTCSLPTLTLSVSETDMPFDACWKCVIERDVFYSFALASHSLGHLLWSSFSAGGRADSADLL